jgi:hypothetical protein
MKKLGNQQKIDWWRENLQLLNKFLLLKNTFLLTHVFSTHELCCCFWGEPYVCASSRCGCIYLGRKKESKRERESAMRGCVHCAAGGRLALPARSQPWPFPAPHARQRKERKAEERMQIGCESLALSLSTIKRVCEWIKSFLWCCRRAHRRNKVASMFIYMVLWCGGWRRGRKDLTEQSGTTHFR